MDNETAFFLSALLPTIMIVFGLVMLFLGWIIFKAGIYSTGYLTGFTFSFLFVFSLGLESIVFSIILVLLIGGALGFIFARSLWHVHKFILALLGLLTSTLVNFWFAIPSLFETDATRIMYLIIVTALCMAIFIYAEKYLIILLTSLMGGLILNRFLIVEWDLAQIWIDLLNNIFPGYEGNIQKMNIYFFLALMLFGILIQCFLCHKNKKRTAERKP